MCISQHGFPSEIYCNYLWIWSSVFLKNTSASTVRWFLRLTSLTSHHTAWTLICPVWREQVWTSMGLHKLLRALRKSSGNFSITSDLLHFFFTTKYMLGITISLNIFLMVSISSINVLVLNSSLKPNLLMYF